MLEIDGLTQHHSQSREGIVLGAVPSGTDVPPERSWPLRPGGGNAARSEEAAIPSATITSDPTLALRWLAWLRRTVVVAQVALGLAVEVGSVFHVHSFGLVVVLVVFAIIDGLEAVYLRWSPPTPGLVRLHAGVDLVGLSLILFLGGGPDNPLQTVFLAYIAVFAVVLGKRDAWLATGAAVLLEAGVVLVAPVLPGTSMERGDHPVHFAGHVVAFVIAAVAINAFVGRLAQALRRREAAERDALARRAATERLAALGTLAAGVAHELGTPLGTIQLLLEEHREGVDNDDAIEAQVTRCRALLERLRTGEGATARGTALELGAWIEEWRRAHPALEVRLDLIPTLHAAGSEDGWRGALWTVLDNAERAGARTVCVCSGGDGEIHVDDDGVGLASDVGDHAGEPFRSGWGSTGLGLHVARSFARAVGGDVRIEPRPGGGCRAILVIPRGSS